MPAIDKSREPNFTSVFLANARQEIDLALSEIAGGQVPSERLQERLAEAISLLAKAWHVRDLTQQQFEELEDDEIRWLRHAIPDLAIGSESFHIVPADAAIGKD